jgi:hypothetical protein
MARHAEVRLPAGYAGVRVTLHADSGAPLSNADVLNAWRVDESFRAFFIGVLAGAPLQAYRWETPVMTRLMLARPFEFALVDEPALRADDADPSPFAEHIEGPSAARAGGGGGGGGASGGVVRFANLRGDAVLVVPREIGPRPAYGHLAAFTRNAPVAQQHELWQLVATEMLARLGDRPVWLSTAGLGVPWLHVRLDDRPKYYAFRPYATAPT